MDAEYVIEMKDICKSFYGGKVLHDVNFRLRPREIRGLLGENGAGKSTLMRVLNGIYSKDSGKILVDGEEKHFSLPKDARAAKIAFVHQEIALSANLTIAQNMFLGLEETKGKIFVDDASMRKKAMESMKSLGLDLNVDAVVGTLSIAQQQMVEIAKALMQDARVLVLDEPTAALSEKEVRFLFKQMKRLKEKNVAIIFISHRLNEIEEITDSLTVLRDGCSISDGVPTKGLTSGEIIAMMWGATSPSFLTGKSRAERMKSFLKCAALTNRNVKNVSFQLRRGEILGFGGLVGAGRTELMSAIFGLDPH
jgi:ribose transport system ATP-binding protein/inositol transport system ATP-binding protein